MTFSGDRMELFSAARLRKSKNHGSEFHVKFESFTFYNKKFGLEGLQLHGN